MTTEGVDFSSTPRENAPSIPSLHAAGKEFVGRYAVNDKSPNGRGIDAAEYQRYVSGGIDVFVYWESSEGWMLGGFEAGATAARNAQRNIEEAGMPASMPIYFACDFDAAENQQPAIDGTLRGCASVVGDKRVGLYAGYFPLQRSKQNGTAQWFCQTLAWSGGRLMEGVHLYQYDTQGNFIDGTDCDLVRAYQDNYGQASKFTGSPPIDPTKPTASPIWWEPGDIGPQKRPRDGAVAMAMVGQVTAKRDCKLRTDASAKAKVVGKMKQGDTATIVGTYLAPQKWIFVSVPGIDGYPRVPATHFFENWPTI